MHIKDRRRLRFLYLAGDLVILIIAGILSMYSRFGLDYSQIVLSWYIVAFNLIALVVVLSNFFSGLYDLNIKSFAPQIQPIFNSLIYGLTSFVMFTFFVREITFSRLTYVYFGVYAAIGLLIVRFIVTWFVKGQMKKGIGTQKMLAIGTLPGLVEVVSYLVRHPEFGYKILGVLMDGDTHFLLDRVQKVDSIGNYESVLQLLRPDVVLLGVGHYETERQIVQFCERYYIDVLMIPDIINLFSSPVGISQIASVPLIRFKESPLMGVQGKIKRLFDSLFSILGLVILSPAFLVIGIIIKISSPGGPVIFAHNRLGRNGRIIKVYKFRSMVPNADDVLKELLEKNREVAKEFEKEFKLKNDPRVFPFGKIIRKTSLDELPQLFNVIKGDMALVGPRPIVPDELENYGEYSKFLLRVPPGITGLWQVSGRSDISYKERIKLDMFYINNWSVWLDIIILFKTIPTILVRKGAY